ncbi:Hypothetical predicted protein [Cloeon dipterum]|uniref:DUF4201 domain-containing protein n=1 Tax=Cloeon dipterum TaxID=197152 RepID=A0A8S1CU05_9INSE|nr:Hypothetical predicted protein [Cloeon dipterum]
MSEGSCKSQDYLQLKEVDEEISKNERRLAHVSKFIGHKYLKDGMKIEVDDTEIDETEFERGILEYFEANEEMEHKKRRQYETKERLLNEYRKAEQEHELAREDLRRILLGIYFSTRPKMGSKKSRRASLSEQSEELNNMFEEQKMMEDKVLKLRLKLNVNAQNAQQKQESKESIFKRELKMLEQQMRHNSLRKKLSAAQNLLSRNIALKDALVEEGEDRTSKRSKFKSEIAMLKSDDCMSELALKQRYKELQLQHEAIWNKINEAEVNSDLTILSSIKKQHSKLLKELDEEIRSERADCETFDQLLSKYSDK